jgi:hypothetical protein
MISRSEDSCLELILWIRSYTNEPDNSPPSSHEDLDSILRGVQIANNSGNRWLTPQFEGVADVPMKGKNKLGNVERSTFSRVVFFLLGHYTLPMNSKV